MILASLVARMESIAWKVLYILFSMSLLSVFVDKVS